MECEDVCYYLCAYLDGELDQERAESIEEHLEVCSNCRRELELQRSVKSLVRGRLRSITAPDYLKRMVTTELEKVEEYRESGIQILDLVRWGTHIAHLCKAKDELTELLVPYMERGLEQNELCVWVASEMSQQEVKEALGRKIPCLQHYLDTGQLQIFTYEDWYLPSGFFDSQRALDNGFKKYSEALSRGYEGLRLTGNLSWLDRSNWDSFMEYENHLNDAIRQCKLLVVCVYREDKCTIDNIVDVIGTHKYVISKMNNSWQLRRSAEIGSTAHN